MKRMTIQHTLSLAVLMACNAQLANAQFLDNIQVLEDSGVGTAIILDNVNPNVDWYIQNNNLNGDLFFVSYVNNVLNGIPLSIDENAGDDALYLGPSGAIGVGTLTPGGPLNSKLSVAGSAGVASVFMDNGVDEWSMGSSTELGAFIAEGSTPYLNINAAGNVGISPGASGPEARLHVGGVDDARILVRNANSNPGTRADLFVIENDGAAAFRMYSSPTESWAFNADDGFFRISKQGSGKVEMEVFSGGNVTIGGTLTQSSSREVKHGLESVDIHETLAAVNALKISEWSYIHDTADTRHIGPMAEDFYDMFGVGTSRQGISTIDTSGVAFASIQALSERYEDIDARTSEAMLRKNAEIESLREALSSQAEKIAALEALVRELVPDK